MLCTFEFSTSHSTTQASSSSERITLVLFICFLDTSGWVGGIAVSLILFSWVSVGTAACATSTWPSASFIVCISTPVVVWADYAECSESAGLGLLSFFCVFLAFLTLGIFKINVFKIWWELSWPVEKVLLTDQLSMFVRFFIQCQGFMFTTWHVYWHRVATELGLRHSYNVWLFPAFKPTLCMLWPSSFSL